MPDLEGPAPGCTTSWPDTTAPEVLIRLLDIHAKTAHPDTHTPPPATAKVEKVKRPSISASGSSEEGIYFTQRWSEYKAATHLTGLDTIYQLLECCDEALWKDLTHTFGSLSSSDETVVLQNIKTLAVRQENIMVARVRLQHMRQDRDEPVRAFAARLKGQAGECNFVKTCTNTAGAADIDYSDDMIRDALLRGIADDEIRLEILGHSNQKLTLEETLQLIEAKESGKRSAGHLLTGADTTTAAATSSYRRQERSRLQGQPHTSPQSKPPVTTVGNQAMAMVGRSVCDYALLITTPVLSAAYSTTTRVSAANHSGLLHPTPPPSVAMPLPCLKPSALWMICHTLPQCIL